MEIREVNKGEYFIHEGEPSKFFAGLIKGRISFRKSKIINIETNEIVLKHLYKASLLRKPTINREAIKNLTKINSKFSNINPENKANNTYNNNFKKIMNTLNLSKSEKNADIKSHQRLSIMLNYSTLRSHISLIKNKYSSKQEYKIVKEYFDPKKYIIREEELFQAGAGYCFGEWALIYNQPRSASVVTLEDCIFFILDEKIFTKTFLKCLNNSEQKKKKFTIGNLFPFDLLNERKSSIYKNIIPINCVRNQVIFNEGDKAETIYLIYLGTFILEKKYKHKKFSVLSLEKGSIVGLESIFEEEENRRYKCTLKLTSYDELGLIFSCNVNKLVPYIIKKMKESFKKIYMLYLKTSEEFYLNNINIQKKMFFKKKDEEDEEKKEQKKNNTNSNRNNKRYSILKKANEDEKMTFLNDIKKVKSIKFRNYKQLKMDSFPFLKTTSNDNDSKNRKNNKIFNRRKKRAKTIFNKVGYKELKLNSQENETKYIRNQKRKRVTTYFNYNPKLKNQLNLINEDIEINDEENKNNNSNIENNKIEEKKYIEAYKEKKIYNFKNKINEINDLLDINKTDSISEKFDLKTNQISTLEMSNINNKYNKDNSLNSKSSFKTIKSSFKILSEIEEHNSEKITSVNDNSIKNKLVELKEKILMLKKNRLENDNFYKKDNESSRKIFYFKNNQKSSLNLTPIKINKNKLKIEKYVNYLLSYTKEKNLFNLNTYSKNVKDKTSIKSEEKHNNKIKIKNIFNKYKSVNKIFKSRNKNNNDNNFFDNNTIYNSELSYSKTNLFTFNSGAYKLPLLTQIIMMNKKE